MTGTPSRSRAGALLGREGRRLWRRLCRNSAASAPSGAILASEWISARIGSKPGFGRVLGPQRSLAARRTVEGSQCWLDSPRNRDHQPVDPDQGDHSFDVVGQHVQRHFRSHPPKPPGQEMAGPSPGLDRAEQVLDRRATDAHRGGRTAAAGIRSFDKVFLFPPGDPSLVPRGATAFAGASLASVCPITPHLEALLFARGAVDERPSRRAAIDARNCLLGEGPCEGSNLSWERPRHGGRQPRFRLRLMENSARGAAKGDPGIWVPPRTNCLPCGPRQYLSELRASVLGQDDSGDWAPRTTDVGLPYACAWDRGSALN